MLPTGRPAPTRPTGSFNVPRRDQTDGLRSRALPSRSTDVEEIQLEPVPKQPQSHDERSSSQETSPAPPDDPHSQSPNASPNARPPALYRALTYSSLVLENSGNIARDHLSTERTWLAYMRTSLLIAATGIGIVQFFAITLADNPSLEAKAVKYFGLSTTVQRFARPLGESAIFLALCLMVFGFQRYFQLQCAIMRGSFPAAWAMVLLFSAALAIIAVVTCGILLTLP